MKKLMLMLAALALVASCTQPPRCSRDGRSGPAEFWDTSLELAEAAVRYDAIDGTEGIVSVLEDWNKRWESEHGVENTKIIIRSIGVGLMEIADGKCGGTPSQQRTARKILERLRTKIGFG